MSKPILVLDFDGVLHAYTSGWQGADVVADGPVAGATAFLKEAINHFDVCVISSRSSQDGGIEAMERELRWWLISEQPENGEYVFEQIRFPTEKPAAFLTIDDRAVCFEGTFPRVAELLDFKPWNKRGSVRITGTNSAVPLPV